jgi:4-amino-4-deoxy-L-arabinose transferase-like glycosyltransferase
LYFKASSGTFPAVKAFLQRFFCGAEGHFSHRDLISVVSAALAIVAFVVLAAWNVSLPGLQYDEVLFVPAAIGAPNGLFVYQVLAGIPVMTMSYLGALKVWIYAPIFFLFGVSPITIRLPAILISALTLVLIYRLLRREAGPGAAGLAIWLTALDTAFIFHSRLDWGPVVLSTLLKIAVLGCVLGFVRKPGWKLAAATAFFSVLGMWDKLNFVWFLAGVFVAAAVCYPGLWISFIRKARPTYRFWALATGLVVALILTRIGVRHWNLSALDLSLDRIQQVWVNTLHTFSGTLLTSFLMNHPLGFPAFSGANSAEEILKANPLTFSSLPLAILLALIPVVLIGVRGIRRQTPAPAPDRLRVAVFFLVLIAVSFFMIVLTPDSGHMHQSHHMMILHPFHILLVALAFQGLLSLLPSRAGWISLFFFCGVVGWVLVSNLTNTISTLNYLDREERVDLRWSTRIYELARQLNESASDVDWVISVDWGIHNQLLALGTPVLRTRLDDLWLQLKYQHKNPKEAERLVDKLRNSRRTLVVCYPPHEEVQCLARPVFFRLLDQNGIPYHRLTTIGRRDFVVYEVFEILGKDVRPP